MSLPNSACLLIQFCLEAHLLEIELEVGPAGHCGDGRGSLEGLCGCGCLTVEEFWTHGPETHRKLNLQNLLKHLLKQHDGTHARCDLTNSGFFWRVEIKELGFYSAHHWRLSARLLEQRRQRWDKSRVTAVQRVGSSLFSLLLLLKALTSNPVNFWLSFCFFPFPWASQARCTVTRCKYEPPKISR